MRRNQKKPIHRGEKLMSHETALPPGHFHHLEPEQAYHASKLGMWLFLATEILFFGGLFCAYAIFRAKYPQMFHAGSQELNVWAGAGNTVVLLTSSFFMVLAVDSAQHGNNRKVVSHLGLVLLCAVVFMVVKYFEYTAKFDHGIYPSTSIYFGLYFCMTALHGIHVLVGMGVIWWVLMLARKDHFSETYYTPVEIVGLYWHLVDVIWIYLFPLLYLIR